MFHKVNTESGTNVVVDIDGYDRIRESSPEHVNQRISGAIRRSVESFSEHDSGGISKRISELDHEWDIDRAMMAFYALVAGIGLVLGTRRDKRWLLINAQQVPFMLWHAARGWCPPAFLFRRLGFRSRDEINSEKYALKTLRGDYRNKAAA